MSDRGGAAALRRALAALVGELNALDRCRRCVSTHDAADLCHRARLADAIAKAEALLASLPN